MYTYSFWQQEDILASGLKLDHEIVNEQSVSVVIRLLDY